MGVVLIKLLNMSISAGWMILVVIVLRVLLRKAPKWSYCLLWALVALRLIIPFTIESTWSLIPSNETITLKSFSEDMQQGRLSPDTISVPVGTEDKDLQSRVIRRNVPVIDSGIPQVNQAVNEVINQTYASTLDTEESSLDTIILTAGIVWISGVTLMLSYALFNFIRLKRIVRESVTLQGIVRVCDSVKSSFVFGIIRPYIYLPSTLSEEQQGPVIAHEMAHLSRRDHIWKLLGWFLLSVYWFNPLIWLAYSLLCRDIEMACDEKVIKDMKPEEKKNYSIALLEHNESGKTMMTYPLAFGEVGVRTRIKNVLTYKKPALWIIIITILACGTVAICFLTNPVKENDEDTQPRDAQSGDAQPSSMGEASPTVTPVSEYPKTLYDGVANGHLNNEELSFDLSEYPELHFLIRSWQVTVTNDAGETVLAFGSPIYSVFAEDISGDGYPEVCITSTTQGLSSAFIIVYNPVQNEIYQLIRKSETEFDFVLFMQNDKLQVIKSDNKREKFTLGTLAYQEDINGSGSLWIKDEAECPANILNPLVSGTKGTHAQDVYTTDGPDDIISDDAIWARYEERNAQASYGYMVVDDYIIVVQDAEARTARLVKMRNVSDIVNIPDEVAGYRIIAVGESRDQENTEYYQTVFEQGYELFLPGERERIKEINVPAGIEIVEWGVFDGRRHTGLRNLQRLVFSSDCEVRDLNSVVVHSMNNKEIGYGMNPAVWIVVPKGSKLESVLLSETGYTVITVDTRSGN